MTVSIIGIDPGITGGIAVMCGGKVVAWPMPVYKAGKESVLDVELFVKFVEHKTYSDIDRVERRVYIEKAQSMPKQGVSSVFKYGKHYGELLGILRARYISLVEVHPRTWHTKICIGCAGKPKEKALITARNLFPDVNLKASERSKKPHEGIIDALLIAEYGKRQNNA